MQASICAPTPVPATLTAASAHVVYLDVNTPSDAPEQLRAILDRFPDLVAAKLVLARILGLDTTGTKGGERLRLLQELMEERPNDVTVITDYMALLQQVQMAREALGTHPAGSLSNQILAAGMRALGMAGGHSHAECYRLMSVQYRYKRDFAVARRLIVMALAQNLIKFSRYICKVLDRPAPFERLTLEQLRFTADGLFEMLNVPKAELDRFSGRTLECMRQNIAYCRSDLGFVNLYEALESGGELAPTLMDMAEEDFSVAYDIYPKCGSIVYGLAEMAEARGNHQRATELLVQSYAIEKTYTVRDKLRARGIDCEESSL